MYYTEGKTQGQNMEEERISSFDKRLEEAARSDAKFYIRFCYDEKLTRSAGRPMFVPKVFIRVNSGDGDIKDLPANDIHKNKFRAQWDIFQRFIEPQIIAGVGDDYSISLMKKEYPEQYKEYIQRLTTENVGGTLLDEIGILPGSVCRALKYRGIFSVEQLALLPEHNGIINVEVIDSAKEFIRNSQERGYVAKLNDEITKLKEVNQQQALRINELMGKLNASGTIA